ncbi:class I SAM-dependent methyltransferase [Georgenia sunbinii]|uniref:class I SAM-dependent methyltransferase n=1 Tax=Georgenia sunbinii TaxID=3117728 RepID=UPI002F260D70
MPRRDRLIGHWDGLADSYDQRSAAVERRYLAASRRWVCRRATGDTLELAVGTGLNLPHYPPDVSLTAVDWSERMVAETARRAGTLSLPVTVQRADAARLPFGDRQFDTVVATFALCCVPDERAVIGEAARVLRPGGRLLLADHVVASQLLLRGLQHVAELVTVLWQGEHLTRRPLPVVRQLGLEIVETERLSHGAIERVHARTPR